MREDHLLHDDGHVDLPVVEAVPQAVGHGPLGEQRGPAPADVLEDRGRPHDVQVRVLLAREGGRRQVLCRRARPDGVGGLLAETGERAGDRRRQIVRDGDPFEGPADLRAERADPIPVVRVQARQPIEPIVDRRRFRHRSAGKRPSSRRSQAARGCLRCARAPPGSRPCRRRPRPASRRSLEDPTRNRRLQRPPPHALRSPSRCPFVACGERVWSTPPGLKQPRQRSPTTQRRGLRLVRSREARVPDRRA